MILVGSDYWRDLIEWMRAHLVGEDKISPGDMDLITVTDDPAEVRERLMAAAHRPARASRRNAP